MRILYVIESLEFGGAEKVVVSLANGFARDHSVTVLCVKRLGELRAELDPGIDVLCLSRPEGTDPGLIPTLWRLFRMGRFDIVHSHNWSVFAECGFAAMLARVPVLVHTAHGRYAPLRTTPSGRLKLWLRHRLEWIVSLGYSQIVTVSNSIQMSIGEAVGIPATRLVTIHNGIEPGEPSGRRSSPVTTFVSVGRLVPVKMHDLMVRAFVAIAEECPGARLLIVGDGPKRQELEKLIRECGAREQVEITGFRQDVCDLLARSDIFVLTSSYEGISIALLEAMRAGLPTIATRVGGVPETVLDGQTGLLVDPADVDGLRLAMVHLCRDRDRRRRMGEAARNLLERDFSLQMMRARYLSLYQAHYARRSAAPVTRCR